ncbi:ABC-2 type transporter [Xylanimonas cellulosilytica DSM 15894]|uniref:Transport permease protein n=1 Tax=Xylanimonas cellulosilytica (strain DSM 15894 / JCM 12276 / CECT 5975 / KCTC 9989 / LMG 20990 / NBRC 107835 / XIL07) TaxID=446471 RepID=D1C010_XYLCX|nr:ABC transporter permease [Xylanimonas cellulosilytica]ACZ32138.1 ABC-2 type transporter [Xylanimonas cellulosilytica DSM 15894]
MNTVDTLHAAPTTPRAATRPAPVHSFVRDTGIVLLRELRPVLRDPFSLVFGLVQPLVFLALFGPLLVGSMGGSSALGGDVWQWFVPSILLMTTLFGTSTTGSNLQMDMQTGSHERMLVSPLTRSSLLVGRALKEMVPIVAQSVIVVLVMIPFGFRLDVVGAVLGLVMLAVLGVGIGSLSYALALAVRKQEWMFWMVQQTVLFPVMLLSGMLLPIETGPRWMQVAAHANPLSYVVDAQRALFAGDLASGVVVWGWVAAGATAAVGLLAGIRAMVRSTD